MRFPRISSVPLVLVITVFATIVLLDWEPNQTFMVYYRSSLFVRSMSTSTVSTKVSSSSTTKGVIIFLHGLGDGTPVNGWEMSLEEQLVQHKSSLSTKLKYIFPKSPIIPISINGGMKMPGWFDLYDWPIEQHVLDDVTNIQSSIQSVIAIINQCMIDYNLSSTKQIIVGGFSQGGAIALLTAYHPIYGYTATAAATSSSAIEQRSKDSKNENVLGGCINLSGWLPLRNRNDDWVGNDTIKQLQQRIPLFWGHGTYDDKVLPEHQPIGIQHLVENHCINPNHITSNEYPVGHSSHPNEMKALSEFIDNIFFHDQQHDTDPNSRSNEEL